ncbi:MAG TPA: two-component regulator propeller domain-containing protein, partial [Tepidisphaeraceae bacterium]|nr:two-component regulator propeller domain-containing protein [Tepidisphaeraceae bacterium]
MEPETPNRTGETVLGVVLVILFAGAAIVFLHFAWGPGNDSRTEVEIVNTHRTGGPGPEGRKEAAEHTPLIKLDLGIAAPRQAVTPSAAAPTAIGRQRAQHRAPPGQVATVSLENAAAPPAIPALAQISAGMTRKPLVEVVPYLGEASTPLDVALHPSLRYGVFSEAVDVDTGAAASRAAASIPLVNLGPPPAQPAHVSPPPRAVQSPAAASIDPERAERALIEDNLRMERSRQFVTSMCADRQGRVWVGCEPDTDDPDDGGVQCFDPAAPPLHQWKQYTAKDGLGDNYAYAIACDRLGRIWVGHLNHGVSVYNGKQWQNYEPVGGTTNPNSRSGPLGERVFHISVNQNNGDVWIATNCGLTRYAASTDRWMYYGRANGLPSDDASAIAFDGAGNIYVATQCDGVAVATAQSQYTDWRVTPGPRSAPSAPAGKGLPSGLTNDVLVSREGIVWVATDYGIAWSADRGASWKYVRGMDWAEEVKGRYGGPPAGWKETPGAALAEDYCTCLAEDAAGSIFVGHRSQPLERITPAAQSAGGFLVGDDFATKDDFTTAVLPTAGGALVGTYGNGVTAMPGSRLASPRAKAAGGNAIPLPGGAPPPTAAELGELCRASSVKPAAVPSTPQWAVACSDDWRTRGDWLGRYGRYWAML